MGVRRSRDDVNGCGEGNEMPGTPAYRAGHERLDAAISVVRVKSTVAVQVSWAE